MKRLDTIKINIGGKEYPFRFSVLSFMMFSDQFGKEITACKTLSDQLHYFYCAYQAGCEYLKIEKEIKDLDSWIILLDDYPEALKEMGEHMSDSTAKKK